MSHISTSINMDRLNTLISDVSTLSTTVGTINTSVTTLLNGSKLVTYTRQETVGASPSSTFNISIAQYDSAKDSLSIFVDGVRLNSDQYSATATVITTVTPVETGKVVGIVVLKVVPV